MTIKILNCSFVMFFSVFAWLLKQHKTADHALMEQHNWLFGWMGSTIWGEKYADRQRKSLYWLLLNAAQGSLQGKSDHNPAPIMMGAFRRRLSGTTLARWNESEMESLRFRKSVWRFIFFFSTSILKPDSDVRSHLRGLCLLKLECLKGACTCWRSGGSKLNGCFLLCVRAKGIHARRACHEQERSRRSVLMWAQMSFTGRFDEMMNFRKSCLFL